MVVWVLVWFQFMNNSLTHYDLGQFPTEMLCKDAKEEAVVLITGSTMAVFCFEIVPEQAG
tara:strand:- start:415 stop:594 length:180 start_codon:yes stop_codon:yes gene_type:complete